MAIETAARNLPPVATIVTAYNAESTIGASLRSALAQDYAGPHRIIVVDDGSSDNTAAVAGAVGGKRVEVHRLPRSGRSRALNRALDLAHGAKYVANLDADDFMFPERLSKQISYLESVPNVGVLGAAYVECHGSSDVQSGGGLKFFEVRPPTSPASISRGMAAGFPVCHSLATYRRDTAVELGGFSPLLRARLDFDLWLRFAAAGSQISNLPDVLGVHLKHPGTYFDRQFSPWRSATQMARLNFLAASRLHLGVSGYFTAAARFGYSLSRRGSVKPQPRFGRPLRSEEALHDLAVRTLSLRAGA